MTPYFQHRLRTVEESEISVAWQGPPQCKNCGIRHLVLFADLQPEDFRHIHRPIEEYRFKPGELLYRAHEKPEAVFTIREGIVKLVQYLPNGDQRIVRLLTRGDLAGMEALVGTSFEHNAVVLESVLVCKIPLAVVEDLSRATPRLHRQLMQRWQRAVSAADSWVTELSTGPARARIARLLIRLMESTRSDIFFLPGREDMGAMVGITTETTSRVIAEFRREGVLRVLEASRATADLPMLRLIAQG